MEVSNKPSKHRRRQAWRCAEKQSRPYYKAYHDALHELHTFIATRYPADRDVPAYFEEDLGEYEKRARAARVQVKAERDALEAKIVALRKAMIEEHDQRVVLEREIGMKAREIAALSVS